MVTTFTKISGVLFVLVAGNTNPKSYFGATGQYQFSDNDSTVSVTIGLDVYVIAWQDVRVGTSTPTTVSQAKVLLNSIFGT